MIYHVNATYADGSNASGLVIADSTEPFQYRRTGDLTSYAVLSNVGRAKVQFVSWTEFPGGGFDNDTVSARFIQPLPSEWSDVSGTRVEHARYRGRTAGTACRLWEYDFERFEENADSLILDNLTSEDGSTRSRQAFPKGDIKATLDSSGFVERFEIEELVVGIHPSYRSMQPLEIADSPTVCVATYWLHHVGPESQRISDYGVFKPFWSCRGESAC